jgi:hypothetical protein
MLVSDLKTGLKRFGFDNTDPLLVWLNAAYHFIEESYEKWSFLETTETVSVTQALNPDGRVILAGKVQRIIKVRDITDAANGGEVDLDFWDRRKFGREIWNQKEQGNPTRFTIIGSNTIQVHPVPPPTRTLEVIYIKALSDLAADGEEPLIPVKNHYLIVEKAAAIALQAENEEDRAANAEAIANNGIEKMIHADMKRQVGQPGSTEDVMAYGS